MKEIDTGVALGAWVAGGTTGGHVNPVVCPLPCVILFPVLRRTESFRIGNSMHGCL